MAMVAAETVPYSGKVPAGPEAAAMGCHVMPAVKVAAHSGKVPARSKTAAMRRQVMTASETVVYPGNTAAAPIAAASGGGARPPAKAAVYAGFPKPAAPGYCRRPRLVDPRFERLQLGLQALEFRLEPSQLVAGRPALRTALSPGRIRIAEQASQGDNEQYSPHNRCSLKRCRADIRS